MIVHIFKVTDEALTSYFIRNYNLLSDEIPDEIVEIRYLNYEEKESLTKLLKRESINHFSLNVNETFSNILILENPIILAKISSIRESFSEICEALTNYLKGTKISYEIGNRVFGFNKSYLMGIINVTPDSFSDGGKFFRLEDAVDHGLRMIDSGVDIIDIGGESSRPGSDFISEDEEKRRVLPLIERLLSIKSDLILSIDTTKSKVAECAIDLGVKIVNDISAMILDENMINVCKKSGVAVILMHMQGIPKTMQLNPSYNEVISDIYDFLYYRINEVKKNNISKIIIDPGIGFGKSVLDNFVIIKRLKEFSTLGYPILMGLSRKSFIGKTLNLEPNELDFPSSILETIATMNSAKIIRTHNVKIGRKLVDLVNRVNSNIA